MCCYFWDINIDTYTHSDLTAQIYLHVHHQPQPNQRCNPSTPLQPILRNDFQTPRVVETKGLTVRTLLVRCEAGCRFQTAFVWFLRGCDLTCQMCWMEDSIYQFGSWIAGLSVFATNIWWFFLIHEFLNVTMNSILHQKNHPTKNHTIEAMKLHQHVRSMVISIYSIYRIYIHILFSLLENLPSFFSKLLPHTFHQNRPRLHGKDLCQAEGASNGKNLGEVVGAWRKATPLPLGPIQSMYIWYYLPTFTIKINQM